MSIHRAQRPDGWRALVERESEREREELRTAVHGAPAVAAERSGDSAVVAARHAPLRAVDDPLELARWEDEGGPIDPHRARLPVNEAVRDLVRACLLPHAPSDGRVSVPRDVARPGPHA
jgi:hypothetical protein